MKSRTDYASPRVYPKEYEDVSLKVTASTIPSAFVLAPHALDHCECLDAFKIELVSHPGGFGDDAINASGDFVEIMSLPSSPFAARKIALHCNDTPDSQVRDG